MKGSACAVRCPATTVLITRRIGPWRGSGIAEIGMSSSGRPLVSMNEPTKRSTAFKPASTPAAVAR